MEKEMVLERKSAMDMRDAYIAEMKLNELSSSTIAKYVADINQWLSIAPEKISKASILDYKENLCKNYKVASVNSKIISINRYLKWLGIKELTVKTKRIQNPNGLENMITKECYLKMLRYADAHNKRKQYCIMKTIAQTGIRIGELKFVTVETVKEGLRLCGIKENIERFILQIICAVNYYTRQWKVLSSFAPQIAQKKNHKKS